MGKGKRDSKTFTTAQVASEIGVHRDTILRWLRKGLIPEPNRDWRGWRIFTSEELAKIRKKASNIHSLLRSPIDNVGLDINRLHLVDWDFSDALTSYLTHNIHPYPAKFIPQIPNALIQELSSVGEVVGDIFCGSGTTLVEALILKRNAIGIDANPLACMMSRAKTNRLSLKEMDSLEKLAAESTNLAESIEIYKTDSLFSSDAFKSLAPRPTSKNLDFWFETFVIEELAEILQWCHKLPTKAAQDFALTVFSSIIVSVSKQDSDTRYVRRKKEIHPGDTASRYSSSLTNAIRKIKEFCEIVEPRFLCSIHNINILDSPNISKLDLVVCSPPYPNAYSYHLYHRTRMLWLSMDQAKFKMEEIGSHRKYSRKGENGATSETFRKEMEMIFAWLERTLKKGKYACFIIGNSIVRREQIDNAEILTTAARMSGFSLEACIPRIIKNTRKAFNPKIGKIKEEKILVFLNGN